VADTYTPLDIITMALKDVGALGVGQTPLPEDTNDAYRKLQWMLAEWNRKRWLIWHLVDLSVTATGATSYSIGPTGSDIVWDPRPDRLESAFLRQLTQSQPNQIDYPLEIIQSYEEYTNIALKSLQSFPSYIFYDSGFPTGTLYPWPVPQASIYAVHVQVKEHLAQFTSLEQDINLPAEYLNAIHWNLCVRLFPQYQRQADPLIVSLAKDSLNTLRKANVQIGRLTMPTDLVRPGIYNPYSDQIR
jgi:hypothetical protein